MCRLLLFFFALTLTLSADEIPHGIERLMARLNRSLAAGRGPWAETTPPYLTAVRVRFVGRNSAMVDAELSQYGSTLPVSRVPVILEVEKRAGAWHLRHPLGRPK